MKKLSVIAPLALNFAALVTGVLAGIFIYRQKMSYFTKARVYMAGACFMFSGLVGAAIASKFLPQFAVELERVVVTLALLSSFLVFLLALHITRYPQAKHLRKLFFLAKEKRDYKFFIYSAYIWLGIFLTWIPQFVGGIRQFVVETYPAPVVVGYAEWFALYLMILVVCSWAYPCLELLLFARKTTNKLVKRSSQIFAISSIGVSGGSMVFNVALNLLGIYTSGITSLLTAFFFTLVAYAFKESTVLSAYFDVFSRRLGVTHEQIVGEKFLLEFDPRTDYQTVVQDFVLEAIANEETVAVFTSKESAVHRVLENEKRVLWFFFSPTVSAPLKVSETQTFVPPDDFSILLNVVHKVLKENNSRKRVCFVFDNLSTMIMSSDFGRTYHFLSYVLNMFTSDNATALFLLNANAHDEKVLSSVRTLFINQLEYKKSALHVVKKSFREIEMVVPLDEESKIKQRL